MMLSQAHFLIVFYWLVYLSLLLVDLVGVAKKPTAPNPLNLLNKSAGIQAKVNMAQAKNVGPFGMMLALDNSEVKQGMGIVLELTKGLSILKNGGQEENCTIPSSQD